MTHVLLDSATATATTATTAAPSGPRAVARRLVAGALACGLALGVVGGLAAAPAAQAAVPSTVQLALPTPGQGGDAVLGSGPTTDNEVVGTYRLDSAPTGGGTHVEIAGRRVEGVGDYRATLRFAPGGVTLKLGRVLGSTQTQLAAPVTVPGTSPTGAVQVRLRVRGAHGTTFLDTRAWAAGTPEPTSWLLSASDSAPELQRVAGTTSLRGYLSSTATRPSTVLVDGLRDSAPSVVLTAGPAAGSTVSSSSATFSFTSPRDGARFHCRLDAGSWYGCASPWTVSGLADGGHTAAVRAVDADGGSEVVTSRSWTVSTAAAPRATITSGPAEGSTTSATSAAFAFTLSGPGTATCSVDGGAPLSCEGSWHVSGLGAGSHRFDVRTAGTTGAAGTTTTRTWTVSSATPAPAPTASTAPTGTRPSAATTGVPDGLALRRIDGNLTITTPGTVLDGVDVHGFVRVRADDVTIRRSVVRGGQATGNLGLITNDSGNRRLLVEDTTLVPAYPSVWLDGIKGSGFTARRVEISGTVDGIKVYGDDVRLEDSWIHSLTDYASDPNQGGGASHNDGVQVLGGQRIAIVGNSISGGSNAALQVTQDHSATTGLVFSRNHADGGGCTVNLAHKRLASMSGITVTDNRFGRATRYADCAVLGSTMTTMTTSGNVWDDNGLPVRIRNNG